MHMRHIAQLTLSAAILVGAAPSAAASPANRGPACDAVRHARVIAASPEAQIYRAQNTLSQPYFYGCAYRGRQRSYTLGPVTECVTPSGCGGTDQLTLSGAVAAYEAFDVDREVWLVVVRDLRSGRLLRRLSTGGGFAKKIVVTPSGTVAWTVEAGLHEYEVHAVDATGSRVVSSGTDVAPRSLALAGNTLYWTQSGKAFSAPLG